MSCSFRLFITTCTFTFFFFSLDFFFFHLDSRSNTIITSHVSATFLLILEGSRKIYSTRGTTLVFLINYVYGNATLLFLITCTTLVFLISDTGNATLLSEALSFWGGRYGLEYYRWGGGGLTNRLYIYLQRSERIHVLYRPILIFPIKILIILPHQIPPYPDLLRIWRGSDEEFSWRVWQGSMGSNKDFTGLRRIWRDLTRILRVWRGSARRELLIFIFFCATRMSFPFATIFLLFAALLIITKGSFAYSAQLQILLARFIL